MTFTRDPALDLPDPVAFRETTDVERLRIVLEWLPAHEKNHDQDHWMSNDPRTDEEYVESGGEEIPLDKVTCGTTACVAGWTDLFAGAMPFDEYTSARMFFSDASLNPVLSQYGPSPSTPALARALLGFDEGEGSVVFHNASTLGEVFDYALTRTRTGQALLATGWTPPEGWDPRLWDAETRAKLCYPGDPDDDGGEQ